MNDDDKIAITNDFKTLCQTLLNADQTMFHDFLFNDNLFKRICQRVRNKNEVKIIRDLSSLLVFFVEILYLCEVINFRTSD